MLDRLPRNRLVFRILEVALEARTLANAANGVAVHAKLSQARGLLVLKRVLRSIAAMGLALVLVDRVLSHLSTGSIS